MLLLVVIGVPVTFTIIMDAMEALFEKGNCLAELGDDEGAVKAYTDALPRHDSPDAVQFAMERAERRLDRGRAVNPHNQAAVWDRGLAQRRAVQH